MRSQPEPDQKPWNSLKELFEFWLSLKNDLQEENRYLEAVKIEEVQLIIYERLSGLSRQIVNTIVRGPMPREEILEEVVNEAVYRMFNAYAGIPAKDELQRLAAAGMSLVAIAARFNTYAPTVHGWFKKHGINRTGNRIAR